MSIFSLSEKIIISVFTFGIGYFFIRSAEADFEARLKRLNALFDVENTTAIGVDAKS